MTQANAARYQFITHYNLFGVNFWLYIQKSCAVPIFYGPTFHCAMHNLKSWAVNHHATFSKTCDKFFCYSSISGDIAMSKSN